MLRDNEWCWVGKFGSSRCPSCEQRSSLWFTNENLDFRFGCKEQCDRYEILAELGLDGYDLLDITPKWLKVMVN